ncbi:MAG TPA: hypothetical protein VFP30_00495 [Candidatus Limnocylindria bacterium]|nr:hypothetical protein [Candidatus Limnocylindria bacterium]
MDRRNLVLRRFGSLDFGLGYFEDGVWVDHTTLPDGGARLNIEDGPFAAVHDLLGCCAVRARPIPVSPDTFPATLVDRRDHVQPVARRSSAG